jgi:GT2 family glycosyltransferase
MLDILMVTYRSDAFERPALDSIRSKTDVPFRLSVIDNNTENRSLTLIWNEFAKQSSAEYLCYANPDILCGAGWANRLLRAFACPEVMVANPSTPYNPDTAGDPCSRLQGLIAPEVFDRVGDIIPEQLDMLRSDSLLQICHHVRRMV